MGIRVQLFGGEKDGDRLVLDMDRAPDLIYTCRANDDRRLWLARGPARTKLIEELGVLAYQLRDCSDVDDGPEYRYDRNPKRDKDRKPA